MVAAVGWGCHSIMAPAWMGVPRRSWTVGGAVPAAAKAGLEGAAARLAAFSMRTR